MNPRNRKFGVIGLDQSSFDELLSLWQKAEALGFDSAWVEDHFMPPMGDRTGPILESWTLLTSLAARTTALRVGTMTLVNAYRNPVLLANMTAALDVISKGRLEVGIGAGWLQQEFEALGMELPKASDRLNALREGIQLLKQLWTQPLTSFNGEHYAVKDAPCDPKPVQTPHPPIWVGGGGEKLTLRIVAEHADGWNAFFMSPEQLRHKLDVLGNHCAAVKRDPASINKSMFLTHIIAPDEASLARKVEKAAAQRNLSTEDLRTRTLVGTPGQCVNQLVPLAELGIEHFIFGMPGPFDLETLEMISDLIVPAISD